MFMQMTPDPSNALFELAANLVTRSSRNIFLTGKAGTGKTTFLRFIRENCSKQIAIVAPTGVAAINAGGVTMHSFFQLPLGPFIPIASDSNSLVTGKHSLLSRLRMNKEKIKLLRQLELLVIDEISMVRSDTMDAIDIILRHVRRKPEERFGGVQVLFIGDMYQLPPIVKDDIWRLLSEYYDGPYFFNSKVLLEEAPLYIEFEKIYRQTNESFIHLLNQVRNNELDADGLELLESRLDPAFRREKNDGYIVLSTHNEKAREINREELARLTGPAYIFTADVESEFSENTFPADDKLELKVGAQVMFIRNDMDKAKRFFNGKIGAVTGLERDKIFVTCTGESEEIEVKREKWENIRYSINQSNKQMEETVIGSFTQYPLRLAWAITIHKSQGLTFSKVIIDAGNAFTSGQVYVALSRSTSLEGIVLKSRIGHGRFFTDRRIIDFSQKIASSEKLRQELARASREYMRELIIQTFDFQDCMDIAKESRTYLKNNSPSFNPEAIDWIEKPISEIQHSQEVARSFQSWVRSQFLQPGEVQDNKVLHNRLVKGAQYFDASITSIMTSIRNTPISTDSRIHTKEFNELLRELFSDLAMKRHLIAVFHAPPDVQAWHQRKKEFKNPAFDVNVYSASSNDPAPDNPHPQLLYQLRKHRDQLCSAADIPIYLVAGTKTLQEITLFLPQSLEELRKINGFGDSKVKKYGQSFLDIVVKYCTDNNIIPPVPDSQPVIRKAKPAKKESNTKSDSFNLFKQGLTIEEIAIRRNLGVQTIEGHMTYYIERGDIPINTLVAEHKLNMINAVLAIQPMDQGLSGIKSQLNDTIQYSDIKFAIAWQKFNNGVGLGNDS